MKNLFYFQIIFVLSLFLNCKEKQPDTLTNESITSLNQWQNVVVDSSYLFSNVERDSLTEKIIRYEKLTTNEIGILVMDSLPSNTNIQYYSTQIANSWGIGKREKDNGLLITISKFDRKVAITTGTGTEKTISDYECKVIIDSIIVPNFKMERYYKGVNKALDSLFMLWD